MPYINNTYGRRDELDDAMRNEPPQNVGELNYKISQLVLGYCFNQGLNYQCINDVMGVLECVKSEFYARIARPYEEKKIAENGDLTLFNILGR